MQRNREKQRERERKTEIDRETDLLHIEIDTDRETGRNSDKER